MGWVCQLNKLQVDIPKSNISNTEIATYGKQVYADARSRDARKWRERSQACLRRQDEVDSQRANGLRGPVIQGVVHHHVVHLSQVGKALQGHDPQL